MKQQPMDWILEQLETKGTVSRNDSLRKVITNRLGAYIKSLVDAGYKFDSRISSTNGDMLHGRYVKTKYGKDYVYTLVAFPKKKKRI